jgi:uncharacterized membrane protein YvbJ
MIKCSNCGRALEDTFHEDIICTYCGKKTNREEALSTSEEEVRRRLIWDISDNIRRYKAIRNIGFSVGPLLIIFAIIMLFSNIFTLNYQIVFILALATGSAWILIGFTGSKRSEATVGKMYDISSDAAEADMK